MRLINFKLNLAGLINIHNILEMSKFDFTCSFGRRISPVRSSVPSLSSASLPKTLGGSQLTINNTSRFEEKKVLRKLHEQDVINRLQSKLAKLNECDLIAKGMLKFRPVPIARHKKQKEN